MLTKSRWDLIIVHLFHNIKKLTNITTECVEVTSKYCLVGITTETSMLPS